MNAGAGSGPQRVLALLVAGGRGARFGGDELKQFVRLGDRPLIAHAAAVLDAAPEIDAWICVAPAGDEVRTRQVLQEAGVSGRLHAVVAGGPTRQQSVWNGLQAAGAADYVVIHDAARPFLTARLLRDTVMAAWRIGAATVATPVSDTLLRVAHSDVLSAAPTGELAVVVTGDCVDRQRLWSVQTPQAFAIEVLRAAHAYAHDAGAGDATDDSGLVLAQGGKVALVPGAWWNLKITAPEDLCRAAAWLEMRRRSELAD